MSDSKVIPIWALIVCWLLAVPMIIDPEFWLELKIPIFLAFLALTVVALRQRFSAG